MPEPEPELLGEEGEEAGEEEEVEEFEDVDDVADTPNEKLLRTSRIDMMTQPESYRNNTQKEELMLEYVANFRRQFQDLYPKRKPLMLCPRNECGVRRIRRRTRTREAEHNAADGPCWCSQHAEFFAVGLQQLT